MNECAKEYDTVQLTMILHTPATPRKKETAKPKFY